MFTANTTNGIDASYTRGFADGEGMVSHTKGKRAIREITLYNTNLDLLEGIREFLKSIGIAARLYPRKKYSSLGKKQAYALWIGGYLNLRRWQDKVGFCDERKQRILSEAISSYSRARIADRQEYERTRWDD